MFDISFWKAIGWVLIGSAAGLGSKLFIILDNHLFKNMPETGRIIDTTDIVFLSLALMGGAGADYFFSVHFHKGWRYFVLFGGILPLVFFAFWILSPVIQKTNNQPTETVMYWMPIWYGFVAAVYCVSIKKAVFQNEKKYKR